MKKMKLTSKAKHSKLKITPKRLMVMMPLLALTVAAFWNTLEVTRYTVVSDKVAKPFTIALITDLHNTNYGKDQHRLISRIAEGEPDIILLSGDIFHHKGSRTKAHELIYEAAKIAPVYFVPGNHETRNPSDRHIIGEVEAFGGVTLWNEIGNEAAELNINGDKIFLVGRNDFYWVYPGSRFKVEYDIPDDAFAIMMCHFPDHHYLYSEQFNLMVSGHAHGGQVRIPWLLPNGLFTPGQGLFPKYTSNAYELSDKFTLVVSRGLSRKSHAAFRVFNRPELVFIDVVNE